MKRIILAITGASGVRYGIKLLNYLVSRSDCEVHFTISAAAAEVIKHELGIIVDLNSTSNVLKELVPAAGFQIQNTKPQICYYHFMDVAAPIASGSFKTDGMVVVPCSMGTLGRLASGASLNLIERAGDVCLKERRKLILVPRETPYSRIHIENMLKLTDAGAVIMPASPGFYSDSDTIDDLINFIGSRVLDHLGIENDLLKRYGDKEINLRAER